MPATFHPFPCLPFELRARIWQLTVEPRTVEVRVLRKPTITKDLVSKDVTNTVTVPCVTSSTPVPAALHTCREARSMGLYQQAFTELSLEQPRHVWLNLDIDMISIGTRLFSSFKPVAHLIARLMFERNVESEHFYYLEASELRSFVNASQIHVVCPEGIEAWHGAYNRFCFPCAKDSLFIHDPHDGRVMRSTELDEMCDQQEAELWRAAGYDYPNGNSEPEEEEQEEEEEQRGNDH